VKTHVYLPKGLEQWLRQDWKKKKEELESEYGPSIARNYSVQKHLVGLVHQARVAAEERP
jgi:hypothetical protein